MLLGLVLFRLKVVKLVHCNETQAKPPRKHYPSELRHITRKRPEYMSATYYLFTAGIWHDRRDVTFPSTLHSASIETVGKHPKRGIERKRTYPLPNCDCGIQSKYDGVDITDQYLSYHSFPYLLKGKQ